MNYGWGVLPLGAIAGEAFRDHPPATLLVAVANAPTISGHTFGESPPIFLLVARAPGPRELVLVIDYPPSVLVTARAPGPITYVQVNDHPPIALAYATTAAPADDEVSLLAPRAVFYGYTFDGVSLSIPIADLVGLSVEEADAVTGDWREILQALLISATEYHRSFRWSIQPRTYNVFLYNQFTAQTINRHFKVDFFTNIGQPHVADEP